MAIEWSDTSQESASNGINGIIYGRSGIGKSMLAATAPQPLIISREKGLLSLARKNIELVFGADREDITYNIPVMNIETLDDLKAAYVVFNDPANTTDIQTLIVDSLTDITGAEVRSRKRLLTSKSGNQANGMKIYGDIADEVLDICYLFKSIKNINVIFIAQTEPFVDGVSGATRYIPSLAGRKLPHQASYEFDFVWCLNVFDDEETHKSVRKLQTQPNEQYEAKSRAGAIPVLAEPHLGHLFSEILK